MKQSDEIQELCAALVKAQAAMGAAVKDSANPYFKSSYADLGSVIAVIKPAFAANGLAYTQFPISDERGVGVTTRIIHSSGQWLEDSFVLPLVKTDPQGAGSAITYARRYALQAIAGIPTADDDAEAAMYRNQAPVQISQDELNRYKQLLRGDDALAFMAYCDELGDEKATQAYNSAEQGKKMAFKKEVDAKLAEANATVDTYVANICEGLESGQSDAVIEHWSELTDNEKRKVWARMTSAQQDELKIVVNGAKNGQV